VNATSSLGHEALLTLTRKLEGAVSDGDSDRVPAEARRLFDALLDHIRAERVELDLLEPAKASELLRGQQRLVDHLVLLAVEVHDLDLSRCHRVVQQLMAELALQAEHERLAGFLAGLSFA
jgi:hypothetical protein